MSRTIVITGASDGIGAAAATMLANPGDTLVVVGRSAQKTQAVAKELEADFFLADFTDLAQVRGLAEKLGNKYPRIDVLANNAGGIMGARELTVDGHEKTFQVNHLAPFLLTTLLIEKLVASRATVINTSSMAHRIMAKYDIDDLDAVKKYSANAAYGNAKLDNILFTIELQRRYGDHGVSAAAFHPGVVGSGFSAESNRVTKFMYGSLMRRFMLTPAQGADTLVWLATTVPGEDWEPGKYYAKRKVATPTRTAQDPALARQLWDRSAAMVAVK
ncbi:NAD(P)-dependent dehydrogenase (short-subunit alcohol dehydrogenase family) [Arthrobacter silviterrae]|uniref:SDR family NAD(P)-dependent oxidoreductase n=1 Tax=Arthrobacter silviterrae TaxID=2026658 RepID=A0ABX0DFB6_9MICC|nr:MULTISPECIES: SDR family NAD(P)-dependent oxidoreductase [Arthrobacter]MCU6481992.1 SDR family NAD(P)-dependent oxidoreductase [Arthrobacter sp. A2-55]MDQ0279048.1 NAD(P)-dependent dehydrogenase (short-subunit alcohol dehydrogenase family) [Arthrobacter silviterrae]NGN84465.1 SDR family NAD(P)-dependent oxidoreductase [Arthrobacter silviterrae]